MNFSIMSSFVDIPFLLDVDIKGKILMKLCNDSRPRKSRSKAYIVHSALHGLRNFSTLCACTLALQQNLTFALSAAQLKSRIVFS